MDTKEKHIRDNKANIRWIRFGVLLLIIILCYWLFSIGMFEDLTSAING